LAYEATKEVVKYLTPDIIRDMIKDLEKEERGDVPIFFY